MRDRTLILLAHGSKEPRRRAPLENLTARLQAHTDNGSVRLAYMESAEPTLEQVAEELAGLGVRRLRLLPLLVSRGAQATDDISRQLAEVGRRFPQVEVEVLAPIGEHPVFMALTYQVALEAIEPEDYLESADALPLSAVGQQGS